MACTGGYIDIVEQILIKNADVHQCDTWEMTPLYIACKGGYKDTVQLLIMNHADVNKCNQWLESPLYVACRRGHTDIVEVLLDNKADVSQSDHWSESPLYVACEGGYPNIVKLLHQKNADVSQCEQSGGQSPLHAACIIDPFDEFGSDEDTYEKKYKDCIEVVKLLIARNADVRMCNKSGFTP